MICFQHQIISETLGTNFATATGKYNLTAISCIYLKSLGFCWLYLVTNPCVHHVQSNLSIGYHLSRRSWPRTSSTSTTNLEEDITRMVDDTHTGIGMQSSAIILDDNTGSLIPLNRISCTSTLILLLLWALANPPKSDTDEVQRGTPFWK
jgi:hypothetical protein